MKLTPAGAKRFQAIFFGGIAGALVGIAAIAALGNLADRLGVPTNPAPDWIAGLPLLLLVLSICLGIACAWRIFVRSR